MVFHELFPASSDEDIETIYDAINGKIKFENGIFSIQRINSEGFTFRSRFLSEKRDASMHRSFFSLYKKLGELTMGLQGHLQAKIEGADTSKEGEARAIDMVANLHLVINSLRAVGQALDRGR